MIRIALNREPVTVPLEGPFAGCTVTLRRLTSNEFAEAQDAAKAILADKSRLVELIEKHDLRPEGVRIRELLADLPFLLGVSEWLAAVECGVRAISAWSGFADEEGRPIEVPGRRADAEARQRWRTALESAFLAEPLMRQAMREIDRAAQLLVVEGNG